LEISVSEYNRGTQIQPQDLDDEDFSLVIDKANYFAFKIDDESFMELHLGTEVCIKEKKVTVPSSLPIAKNKKTMQSTKQKR